MIAGGGAAGARTRRTIAVIQARMGSTRLPGKVLLPLLGEPVLTHVVRRVARARTLDGVVVATTVEPGDDPIERLARAEGWDLVRGSEHDLLGRYLLAAHMANAGTVVRITSDCPLVDPDVVDRVVTEHRDSGADYASNTLPPRTFPRGLDVEAISIEALEVAAREDTDPASREHATPYLYRHPERFRLIKVAAAADHSAHRWTLDTPEDLTLIEHLYDAFGHDHFTWTDALSLVEANPAWAEINRHVRQKAVDA